MPFRPVLFWCHLIAGLVVGVVVFIMSFTGVILTYEKQMLAWAEKRAAAIAEPAPGTARVSLDVILERVRLAVPDTAIMSITRRSDPQAPVSVAMGGGTIVLVHPYTGHVIGAAPTTMRQVFRTTTEWHRYLAGKGENRALGKAITGASNLAFLFLIVSGLYLWIPRRWTRAAFAAIARPRWRHPTARARDFNWHHALGIWSAVPLIVVVASATVISYPWASDLAYRVAGEQPPPRPSAPAARPAAASAEQPAAAPPMVANLDARWMTAESQAADWTTISLRLPAEADAPLAFSIDRGMGGQPQLRGTLTIDAGSGEVTTWESFGDQSPGRQFRSILRFAHTGEVLGVPGQTIAGLVSAAACVLVWTGFALAWRRFASWRRRPAEPAGMRRAA